MPITNVASAQLALLKTTASQGSNGVERKGLRHSSAPTIDKEDRPTIQWRPQPRRRVGTLWKRVRLCPSREEGLPLRRDCSGQNLCDQKRTRRVKLSSLPPRAYSRRGAL